MYRVPTTIISRDEGDSAQHRETMRPRAATPPPSTTKAAYFDEVWLKKRFVALTALACAALAVVIGQFFPSRYPAYTSVLIDPTELRVLDRSIRTPSQFNDTMIAQVESQVRVLVSNTVMRRVVQAQNLTADSEFVGSQWYNPLDMIRALLTYIGLRQDDDVSASDPVLAATRSLEQRVYAKREERTFVVELSVWSNDRDKSVRLANGIVDAYMSTRSEAAEGSVRSVTDALASRLDGLRNRVAASEEAVEKFKRENGILSSSGTLVDEQQVSALNAQLILARSKTAEARAQFDQIAAIRKSGGDAGGIPEAVRSQTLGALRGQYAIAQRREAELSASLLPGHPAMGQVREQTKRLRAEIDKELGRITTAAQTEFERARSGETSLSNNLEAMKISLTRTNDKLVALRQLERDVQANRAVYEAFLLRTQEVGEQEKLDLANAQVISQPEPAKTRSFPPNKPILALGGLFLGLGLGAALAIGLALMRNQKRAGAD